MLTLRSPAKINWCLRILGKRSDGYHDLWTIMQRISLFDELQFRKLSEDVIRVITEPELDLKQEDNLVYRAAELLKKRTGHAGGVEIFLKKNIPLQAGLGGGSSNAATTLKGLNELWGLGLESEMLREVASELGSDVPFFLMDGVVLLEGKGERVRFLGEGQKKRWLLLVKPSFGVSTREAYARFKEYTLQVEQTEQIINTILTGTEDDLTSCMVNDLEKTVFQIYPHLKEIKEKLIENGAIASLLSGSGSTVFGLLRTAQQAQKLSHYFKKYWTKVVVTI